MEVSIRKIIFVAREHMFHHIADTDEMNPLDLPPSPFAALHLCGVTPLESSETSCHILCL